MVDSGIQHYETAAINFLHVLIPYSDSVRILLLDLLLIPQAFNYNCGMKKTDVTCFSVSLNDI